MQVLVTTKNLNKVLEKLTSRSRLALDTETTGLEPFHGDRLFSIIIADESDEYYFDFNIGGLRKENIKLLQPVIDSTKYMFFVNYDYDYTICRMDGLVIDRPHILDCGVMARLDYSLHDPYGRKQENQFFSLNYLAKYYLDKEKDSTVEDYIKKHNLQGEDRHKRKKPLYNKVPLDIMFKYGCSDARLTYDIATKIITFINHKDESYGARIKIIDKLKEESALSKALSEIRFTGIKLDSKFCERAINHELLSYERSMKEIAEKTDLNINSPKQVQKYITEVLNLELPKIIKKGKWTGGYSTDAKTLVKLSEDKEIPMLAYIVTAKQAMKKINTYYKNFLDLKDPGDIIHCGLGQETTRTGRLSSFSPNLQNVHKENAHDYAVRNAFIPRENYSFYFLDYKSQEMVIMVDISGDKNIIEKVKSGVDIYIAMAEMVGEIAGVTITRDQAKALSLGVAYGQGAALIASNLKCSVDKAKKLKNAFLQSLRGVKDLDKRCKRNAKIHGRIHNPYGRVTYIERGFEYKALNALIQGTAADCTKRAVVDTHEFLKNYKSNVVLQIHDEIVLEIHDEEKFLLGEIKDIMTNSYAKKELSLGVDVEHSSKSWGTKKSL